MITKEMVIRDVIREHPETTSVFGKYRVDFCCGGHHSIEETAKACRVSDIAGLVRALNEVAQSE